MRGFPFQIEFSLYEKYRIPENITHIIVQRISFEKEVPPGGSQVGDISQKHPVLARVPCLAQANQQTLIIMIIIIIMIITNVCNMYVCVYIYIYMYMYIHTHTYVCMYVCVYIYTYIYTHTYACVCIYIYIHRERDVCICIYIYIYIYIYVGALLVQRYLCNGGRFVLYVYLCVPRHH